MLGKKHFHFKLQQKQLLQQELYKIKDARMFDVGRIVTLLS